MVLNDHGSKTMVVIFITYNLTSICVAVMIP